MRYYFLLLITCLFCNANAQKILNDLFELDIYSKDNKKFGLELSKEVKSVTLNYEHSTMTFEFDRLGRIIRKMYTTNDHMDEYETIYNFTQNEAGETVCTNRMWRKTYNKYGLLTTIHCIYDNGEEKCLYKYTYDREGKLVTRENNEYSDVTKDTIIYEPDGGVIIKDNNGTCTKYGKYGGREIYVDYGNGTRDSFCIMKYEEYGNNLLKSELELIPNGDTIGFSKYDKKGNLIFKEEKRYVKNVNTLVSTKFVYDKKNRLVEKISYHDGKETERIKFVYNYKGKKTSESDESNVKTVYLETDKYGNPLNYIKYWLEDDDQNHDNVKREYTYFE